VYMCERVGLARAISAVITRKYISLVADSARDWGSIVYYEEINRELNRRLI